MKTPRWKRCGLVECSRDHVCHNEVMFRECLLDAKPIPYRPADITLPDGWTWERVEAQRAKWSIDDNMIPIATVPGACVAWGTIDSVRMEKRSGGYDGTIQR